jgi:hypothetical protein
MPNALPHRMPAQTAPPQPGVVNAKQGQLTEFTLTCAEYAAPPPVIKSVIYFHYQYVTILNFRLKSH